MHRRSKVANTPPIWRSAKVVRELVCHHEKLSRKIKGGINVGFPKKDERGGTQDIKLTEQMGG